MTPEEAAIRERHVRIESGEEGPYCSECSGGYWPCDIEKMRVLVDAARAEVGRLDVARADAFRRGRERERASIAAEVREMDKERCYTDAGDHEDWHLRLSAVLAVVEGGDEQDAEELHPSAPWNRGARP